MYSDFLFFVTRLVNLKKNNEKGFHLPAFSKDLINNSKQRVAASDVIKWHTLTIQMHLMSQVTIFKTGHDFIILRIQR